LKGTHLTEPAAKPSVVRCQLVLTLVIVELMIVYYCLLLPHLIPLLVVTHGKYIVKTQQLPTMSSLVYKHVFGIAQPITGMTVIMPFIEHQIPTPFQTRLHFTLMEQLLHFLLLLKLVPVKIDVYRTTTSYRHRTQLLSLAHLLFVKIL